MFQLLQQIRQRIFQSAKTGTRRRQRARFQPEALEVRRLLSWTTVPQNLQGVSSGVVPFNANAASGTATISKNEVDVYYFVAPRTATYTVTAGRNGSQIDTLAGVYQLSGKLLAGNDDANSKTHDSLFTVYLTGGTKYALGVTNYTGGSNGGYKWSISGPTLSKSATSNGSGFNSSGNASLVGNLLTLNLTGSNASNFYTWPHRVDVYLLDANNKPIHSGSFNLSFNTGGRFVRGVPSSNSMTQSFDLSGWDLRSLRDLRIVVS